MSAERAVEEAFRAGETQEGDFFAKPTQNELVRIAILKVEHACGMGTWETLSESAQMRMLREAESWALCIDTVLARSRRTV